MKREKTILAIILLAVMTGCGVGNKQSTSDFLTIDVTKSYPKKELILQDFMDVEYIALETTDEFVNQGIVRDIGKEIIVITNRINDGDIFLFDRNTGQGIRKFNQKGQGPEDYAFINQIVLDENQNEMFVNSVSAKKILVYDLYGTFKRSFKFADDASWSDIFNYDKGNLIGYDMLDYYKVGEDRSKAYHVIISKQDGSITREISIPFKTIKGPIVRKGDYSASLPFSNHNTITPNNGNWVLVDTSSDTVYNYVPNDNTLTPFLVRTPSIHSMDLEVFLYMGIPSDRYFFMRILKNEYDFERGRGFPNSDLLYDRVEKAIFDPTVYNGDYTVKRPLDMTMRSFNHEIASSQILEANQLVDSHRNGELKDGKLKEIAAKLDAEDNPVIMLVKHKK